MCDLLCLASSLQHSVSGIHSYCDGYSVVHLFVVVVVWCSLVWIYHHLSTHSPADGYFPIWAIVNKVFVCTLLVIQRFVCFKGNAPEAPAVL